MWPDFIPTSWATNELLLVKGREVPEVVVALLLELVGVLGEVHRVTSFTHRIDAVVALGGGGGAVRGWALRGAVGFFV